jgi:uncharacterized DUF497 family protein
MDGYEWDEDKAAINRSKHGIDFEMIRLFDWSTAAIKPDRRYDYGEDRVLTYGRIEDRGFCVAFVLRPGRIRIISLRPMHEKEARRHGI